MKINKLIPIVLTINIALLGLAVYVLGEYRHRTDIVSSEHPITNYYILEVNYSSGFRGGSSVKIAYGDKEYYTGIPTKCEAGIEEKLSYYYDAKNDAVFVEDELNKRYVVFFSSYFYVHCYFGCIPKCGKEASDENNVSTLHICCIDMRLFPY